MINIAYIIILLFIYAIFGELNQQSKITDKLKIKIEQQGLDIEINKAQIEYLTCEQVKLERKEA